MNLNAEFKAYVAGLNVTDKKMKLTLELDVDIKPKELAAVTQMVSESVMVNLGSPQMVMNFSEGEREEQQIPAAEPVKYQTDASGVVVHVFPPLPEPEKEPDMFATPGEIQTGEIVDAEYTIVSDAAGQEGENADTIKDEQSENPEDAGQKPSDKEIEEYILSGKAPHFEDLKFDFPGLLDKKRKLGSWKKVAMQTGDSIGHLTRSFKEYKARVADQMRGGGDIA